MPDAADFASELVDASVAAATARIDAKMPAGVAGECEDCGEFMPRLVGGLCGYCRDGRRPPAAAYDRGAPVIAPAPIASAPSLPQPQQTEDIVADHVNVSVHLRGTIADAVKQRAEVEQAPLTKVVLAIVTEAVSGQPSKVVIDPALVDLSSVATSDLLEEIGVRLARAVDADAAIARADAAETKLLAVASAIGGAAQG